jgi:hypothetical protein
MRWYWLMSAAVLLAWFATALAADLSKIERRLVKEPAYENKPKYGLLVFGPDADTRVWLVFDGDKLYLDKNGNADLTEPGERLTLQGNSFEPVEIVEKDGRTRHKILHMNPPAAGQPGEEPLCYLDAHIDGKFQQYGFVRLADKPQDVKLAYFNGPLAMQHRGVEPTKLTLVRNARVRPDINAVIATPGIDKAIGNSALIDNGQGFPKEIHPVAELEFPPKKGDKPIKLTIKLDQRC